MNWHYVDAGQQVGPVDDAALEALVASGKVTPETLVWKEGMANWQPYRETIPAGLRLATTAPAATPSSGGPATDSTGAAEAVCAECGAIFPINDTIRIGTARVCANCKPIFVQKLREGVEAGAPGAFRYAGFWIRFAAVFLDGLIMQVVSMGLSLAFGFGIRGVGSGFDRSSPARMFLAIAVLALQLLIVLGYETFFIGKYGATLGKMACKIRVVMADGGRVSYLRSLGRYFSKILSWAICGIGYIMAAFDDEKRALHDRICNTRVILK